MKIDSNVDIPALLEAARKARGLTYRDAAGQVGIPHSQFWKIAHNKIDPGWTTVKKIIEWAGSK